MFDIYLSKLDMMVVGKRKSSSINHKANLQESLRMRDFIMRKVSRAWEISSDFGEIPNETDTFNLKY